MRGVKYKQREQSAGAKRDGYVKRLLGPSSPLPTGEGKTAFGSTLASVVLGVCGTGLGFACCWAPRGFAAEISAPSQVNEAAKSDKLAPGSAKAVVTIPKTAPRRSPQPAARPPAPPAVPASTPPPRTTTVAMAAPAEEDGQGEILWSSGKQSSSMVAGASSSAANRQASLTVPLRDGGFYLGDVTVRVTPEGTASAGKERLLQVLAPLLRPQVLDTIRALPDTDGSVSLDALRAAGLDIRFDDAKVEMTIAPGIEQRATGKLSLARNREAIQNELVSRPAIFAGFINMRAGVNYASHSFFGEDGNTDGRVGFDGAASLLDIVLESSATFDMEDGFARGATRLVYDMPDKAIRISAGDVSPTKMAMQGGSDILGISVEKTYQKLQPGASIRPTGSQSFRIERPSHVDVIVNGHVVQKLHLRPGDYDLSDLPLGMGANEIALVIEDDLGHRRKLNFSLFSGRSLLAPGISQWAFSAGVASHYSTHPARSLRNLYSDAEYDAGAPVATGYYERGLTPEITGSINAQADSNTVTGGGGLAMATRFGFFALDGAASETADYGLGYAARLSYELAGIGEPDGVRRSFRLSADHRSKNFANAGTVEPDNRNLLSLSAAYTQDLPWQLSGSVSGTYILGRDDCTGDRYGLDVSLSRAFGSDISAGLNAGYEHSDAGLVNSGAMGGFRASVHLSYRLDGSSSLDASHDARSGLSQLSYRHHEGSGVGSWSAQVEVNRSAPGDDDSGNYTANGAFSYTANRADISVSQHTGLAGLNTATVEQNTSVTAATALAFADGHVAVGRPVSNGFAIITTHANLPDSDVAVGASQNSASATSGLLGPALMADISPYSQTHVAIDVTNLPAGYDLGTGAFDLAPRYKSGYALTVGSDYTVSVYGTLLDAESNPIPLLTGEAREDGQADSRVVTVFTNRAGKFAAQGLRPGRWVLDMATEPKTRFVLEIPKDTVGLFKAGTLKPAGGT